MKSNIEDSDAILIVQYSQLSEVADLRRDGSIELIRVEEAEKATMKDTMAIESGSSEMI